MKSIATIILPVLLVLVVSCNYKSDHPQAGLLKDQTATGMNEVSIRRFVDSLDLYIPTYNKQYSLIYTLGDHSLYVERYAASPTNKVYYERNTDGASNSTLKKYYFKNDSLVLVEISSKQNVENATVLTESRIYLRNNTLFKKESRSASSTAAIRSKPYLAVQTPENPANEENYLENIKVLDDAIQQRNKFDLVFDNITTYPDARYLTLKSKDQNSYKANVLIDEKSAFIDSLLSNPSIFKDEKLKFKWKIRNNEAVYVPESATVTSASGLNK